MLRLNGKTTKTNCLAKIKKLFQLNRAISSSSRCQKRIGSLQYSVKVSIYILQIAHILHHSTFLEKMLFCLCIQVCTYRFPVYDDVRSNSYINTYDTFSLEESIIELFVALSFLVLIEAVIVVALLCRLDGFENSQRKELQKLISEITD